MTPDDLKSARLLCEQATPGPWQWFGNMKTREIDLATIDRGRVFVMQFARWGMSGAQPRFQVRIDGGGIMRSLNQLDADSGPKMIGSHRNDFVGIGHPDAKFIAEARALVPALLDEVERLRAQVADLEANAVRMREYRFALENIPTDGKGNPLPGDTRNR